MSVFDYTGIEERVVEAYKRNGFKATRGIFLYNQRCCALQALCDGKAAHTRDAMTRLGMNPEHDSLDNAFWEGFDANITGANTNHREDDAIYQAGKRTAQAVINAGLVK